MNIFIKIGLQIFAPTLLWVLVTALGFGAQSLANLIEVPAVLLASIVFTFIPERFISLKWKMLILLSSVLVLRALMPVIPE